MSELRKSLCAFSTWHRRRAFIAGIRSYSEKSNEHPEPLRWTKPWSQREGEWYTKFKLFAPEKIVSIGFIKFLTNPKDFSPQAIKSWWKKVVYNAEIMDQQFIRERHNILGNDLAAAHFIIHRGGSVRFLGREKWIKKNDEDKYDIPNNFQPNWYLTAIDCSGMKLHYEGLENIVRLKKLSWLSFKNCPLFDDFCLDRISGEFQDTLTYLDISGDTKITERGLVALYRTTNLETLVVNDISKSSTAFQLTCAMLEELYPNLVIKSQSD